MIETTVQLEDSNTQPSNLTEIDVKLPLFDDITDDIDRRVGEQIGRRISQFSEDMKNELSVLGYECKIKVDVSFGKSGEFNSEQN